MNPAVENTLKKLHQKYAPQYEFESCFVTTRSWNSEYYEYRSPTVSMDHYSRLTCKRDDHDVFIYKKVVVDGQTVYEEDD